MKNKSTLPIVILLTIFPLISFSQTYLFTNSDTLKYFAAKSEPDSDWVTPGFDDSAWPEDKALIGYGYKNISSPNTVIDSTVKSLYVRFSFNIEKKEDVKILDLAFDYDDGYIAYLNGVEVARVNADKSVQFPPYNTVATRSHASELTFHVTDPVLGVYLDSSVTQSCLVDGENCMAIHIINDHVGDDLLFIPTLIDITNSHYNVWGELESRYKRLIDVDSTDLPLVVIETDQYGIAYNQSIWTTAHMGIINNGEGKFNKPSDLFNDYNGLISIRTRGQSSRDFAKQSYRFELIDSSGADTSFVLMGMPKESDWVLFGPFTDKSQVRNKLAYDLASRMGQYAPRTRFCELVINGQLEGLYILTEQIKRGKNRVNISKLSETDITGNDVSGGYIFKYDKGDINMKWVTNGREIVYPDVLKDEQKFYIQNLFTVYDSVLMKSNDFADPKKGFRKYASDSSLVDFIIINEIVKNPDAYLYSTYMYKNRDDKDGLIKFGPIWDCDLAFGNSWFQNGNNTNVWQFDYYPLSQSVMKIQRYFEDKTFVAQFQKRYHELRAKTYSNDSILSFFDELVQQVKLVRERNYDVWPIINQNLFGPGYYVDSYDNEIAYMKSWITTRLEWLDTNVDLIYYPLKRVGNNPLESLAGNINLRIYPNPFESELLISFNLEKESNVRIELYNMTGQLQDQINRINVSGYVNVKWNNSKLISLKSGMYIAKVYLNNTPFQSLKIIK